MLDDIFGVILPDLEERYNGNEVIRLGGWKLDTIYKIKHLRQRLDRDHRIWHDAFGSYDYEREYSELLCLILDGMMLASRIKEKTNTGDKQ